MTEATHEVPSVAGLARAAADHPLEIVGRLLDASNAVFFGHLGPTPVAYKPIRGERPLWDFPTGCLAHRERAAYFLDAAGGFGIIPPTILYDGPAGPGVVQWWITDPAALTPADEDELDDHDDAFDDAFDDAETAAEDDDDEETDGYLDEEEIDDSLFAFVPPGGEAPGWLPVFAGELPDGRPVVFAHADTPELRSVAVLDAILNNGDRKGSHLRRAPGGYLWGIDHGVSLHTDPKLRTVLWGWAGEPLTTTDLARVRAVRDALAPGERRAELAELLTGAELDALTARVDRLLTERVHPSPSPGWPAVPWPVL
ncbi:SCO1664 family protein [Mobilicoccus pelagius]|uniref:Phosphatidylinositol 3-and 4-kinase family protein n=1 Tax=Mobilicoccus pelagius NBRC 104925 TaxID=1089455 RepID=H5UTH4_9MICO|nr:SCO1664 family protein [Mobilicoccus pelagius]GAB49032.1 hypothetical protein MOPEL_096_00390 [Mobilicoccus pelagius NBRC 104925]